MSEELWNRCLSRLEEELPSQQFNMWIRPLQAVADADGSELVLLAPNHFVVSWVKDQYLERIVGLLQELNPEVSPAIRIEVGSSRPATASLTDTAPVAPAPAPTPAPGYAPAPEAPAPARYRSNLVAAYTFDNFVEGKSNRMAFAAAQQVAENPGSHGYNPLLFYGGVGLGKTHLMHAVGNAILKAN
ncbi:MAG: chromosomal replication initiator protein DnaA, partial [Alcanivoracaceae bacterium]|nr:chromosomal replication initiator protein DnaA [Alcanivoracaceae bacterium]